MEKLLDEIKAGLENGTMTSEEANELLVDIQAALEIEDDALDMEMKGYMLTTIAAISKLL
jgi:hypothetical protein